MNLSKEIHDFVQSVVNSRTELLRQHLGNQSDAIKIQYYTKNTEKHLQVKKHLARM